MQEKSGNRYKNVSKECRLIGYDRGLLAGIPMTDAKRYRLLGTYRTPLVRLGEVVSCEVRDRDLVVVGLSSGRIPWPRGRVKGTCERSSLIVFGDLLEAIKRESNQAVSYWFGVRVTMVSKWRRALGVGPETEGTLHLRDRVMRDPERNGKIAGELTGRKRSTELMQRLHKGNHGRKHSMETKKKMSRSHRRRKRCGRLDFRPWTTEEDKLVCILPPAEAAVRTGHPLSAVYSRRSQLGVNDGRTTRHQTKKKSRAMRGQLK